MESNLAVLIDFENIAAGTEKENLGRFDIDALMARIKDKGRVLVARSYADWGRFSRFKQTLMAANVTMMELTSHGMQDKNRADIALVVDALELAFTKDYIDTFVIVSGDSDFTPMVLKLRELNKRVLGCGTRGSTSRLLVQACDEFWFYDSLSRKGRHRNKPEKPRESSASMPLSDAYDLLVEALEGLQRENPDPPLASVIKSAMRRKSPDFSESDYSYPSFARFLESAQRENKIRIVRDQKSGGYRVDSVNGAGDGVTNPSDAWLDPYLPEGTRGWVEMLDHEGLNPLSTPTRKTILELVEKSVANRRKRRRRINVKYVQEDVDKTLRRSHPDVPTRAIGHVFNALMRAGVLMHADGTPIRTGTATFNLTKTAEELNKSVTEVYLDILVRAGSSPTSTLASQLFLGNQERAREIEEILAWLQTPADDEEGDDTSEECVPDAENMGEEVEYDDPSEEVVADPSAEEEATPAELDLNSLDLDDLLVVEESEERPKLQAPASTELAAPARPKKKTIRRKVQPLRHRANPPKEQADDEIVLKPADDTDALDALLTFEPPPDA